MRPILFSTEMVSALLDGRKSMTRRVCKHQHWSHSELVAVNHNGITQKVDRNVSCPYGSVGDVLWVRETWAPALGDYAYKADYSEYTLNLQKNKGLWKPSIHMPKKAARIFLRVMGVRVERLWDITNSNAITEGVECIEPDESYKDYESNFGQYATARGSFSSLWVKINGQKSWDANPWVWVISFERCEKPDNFTTYVHRDIVCNI